MNLDLSLLVVQIEREPKHAMFFDNKKELTQNDEIALLQLTRDFLNRSESNA